MKMLRVAILAPLFLIILAVFALIVIFNLILGEKWKQF